MSRSQPRAGLGPSDASRRSPGDGWIAAGLALYVVAVVGALVWPGPGDAGDPRGSPWLRNAIALTYDDGFYYFVIARHVAEGAGSTFDGVHPTNGYQPLWLLALVPIFWMTRGADLAFAVGFAYQAALAIGGVVVLYLTARLSFGRLAAVLAALLWMLVQSTYWMPLSGMEYGLHAFTVLVVAYAYLRWFCGGVRRPVWGFFALGGLMALGVLARLETIALAVAVGWSLARARAPSLRDAVVDARRLVAYAAPIIAVVALQGAAGLWWFDSALPTSGLVKRDWSLRLLEEDPVFLEHGWVAAKAWYLTWPLRHQARAYAWPLLLGTLGMVPVALAGLRLPRLRPLLEAWQPFIVFSLVQFVGMAMLYHGGYNFAPWYFVMPFWLAAMSLAAVVDGLARSGGERSDVRWKVGVAVVCLAAIGATVAYTGSRVARWRVEQAAYEEPLVAAARWARDALPAEAVVGAWNAGAIAYLSGRRVVNLDGVVNSAWYHEVGRLDPCGYWRAAGITHLVDVFERRNGRVVLPTLDPQPDLSACGVLLEPVWTGPGYSGPTRFAGAYRIAWRSD